MIAIEKEFSSSFFKQFEELENDIESEKYKSKFFNRINDLNEKFNRKIKQSKSDIERLIFLFSYSTEFYNIFISELKKLGFKTEKLEKTSLSIIEPLRRMRSKNILVFDNKDTDMSIIIKNKLNINPFKIPSDIIMEKDLEEVYDFFEFISISLKYFEAFNDGDLDLKKILEKKLTSKIMLIIKK